MSEINHTNTAIDIYKAIYNQIRKDENFSNLDKQELNLITNQIIQIYINIENSDNSIKSADQFYSGSSKDRELSSTESSTSIVTSSEEKTENQKMNIKKIIPIIFSVIPFIVILAYFLTLSIQRIFPDSPLPVEPTETLNPRVITDPSPSSESSEVP